MDYSQFLETKLQVAPPVGIDLGSFEPNPNLFPHQQLAVEWAARSGRALIAMSFGLGKTRIQCDLARVLHAATGKPFLVVCPLGVKHQFQHEDGPALGQTWEYVRTDEEAAAAETPFLITNYERVREGNLNPRALDLAGVSLDKGSVLRDLGSETYQVFNEAFASVPYRYVCTATPSPNRYIELLNYAEFLDVMDRGQALTRWFKRDSSKAGNLTLHPHHEKEFWMWVASWALFLYRPSDLGFDDTGYELPELRVHWHRLAVDHGRAWEQTDNRGQRRLLLDAAGGVSQASQEKRATLSDRIEKLLELLEQDPTRHWLVWHHLEAERRAIEKAVPEAVTVFGSQELETREQRILDFSHGHIRILATKPEIAGSGCNFQRHCYSNVFLGINYQFQDFIQAIHRTHRFQQAHPVDVHIIYAESEDSIVETLKAKWAQHDALVENMRGIIHKYGLSHEALRRDLTRTVGVARREVRGDLFLAVNNDSTLEVGGMPDDSVDLIHTSVPFGNHYEYTTQVEDFGHNPTDDDFWSQMDYLIPSLFRVLKPGRVAAVHVKDRILYGHQTASGVMEVSPFSDDCVRAFRKHGFLYEGRRTIVTDVVRENASTYRLGWTELTHDATKMGSGLPEYLLLFRKAPTSRDNARADEPVTKDKADYTRARWQVDAHALWRSNGDAPRMLSPEEFAELAPDIAGRVYAAEQLARPYDHERHVALCEALDDAGRLSASYMMLPPKVTRAPEDAVWDDVVFMRTLNSEQARGREQNHICPLPFDIVERAIRLYSNPGDLVLDPFAGLFTVPVTALKLGRRSVGVELNPAYFEAGVRYVQAADQEVRRVDLFAWADQAAHVEVA